MKRSGPTVISRCQMLVRQHPQLRGKEIVDLFYDQFPKDSAKASTVLSSAYQAIAERNFKEKSGSGNNPLPKQIPLQCVIDFVNKAGSFTEAKQLIDDAEQSIKRLLR